MSNTHLSRDERVHALVRAANELIMENGISDVSLTAIATRSGVSRQWLYEFFPDIDAIYAALYQDARIRFLAADIAPPTEPGELSRYLKDLTVLYLSLPAPAAMVGSYAINGGLRDSPSAKALRESILGNLDRLWVTPMVSFGYRREELIASVITMMNSVFGLVIAVHSGLTSKEVATRRLSGVIDAVVTEAFGH